MRFIIYLLMCSTTLGSIRRAFRNLSEQSQELSDESENESIPYTTTTNKVEAVTEETTEELTTLDIEGYLENSGYPRGGGIPVLNRKVFNARRVTIYEHPYMASIRRRHAHYVSGALLTPNVVITAAYPVAEVSTTELSVVVGESYSDRASKLMTVVFVILHQDFDRFTLKNDIALLRTYEDVTYKTKVKAISLTSSQVGRTGGSKAFVTGWGRCDNKGTELCMSRSSRFYPDEKVDPMLRSATFTMSPFNNFCDGYKKFDIALQPGMFCTGPARVEDPLSPCLGAPGAPLVVQARLVGLLSWGFGCGFRYDLPLVYTDIYAYSTWILHNIVLLRKISKSNLTELFQATKAFVLTNWLMESRAISPTLKLRQDKNIEPLEVDEMLIKLVGKVYDVRDYINGGMYSSDKQLLYSTLIHSEGNLIKVYNLINPELSGPLFPGLFKNSAGTDNSRWSTMLEDTTPYVKKAQDSSEEDDTDLSE